MADLPLNGELRELARQHQTDTALAKHLGVPRTTLRDHIDRNGLRDVVNGVREDRKATRAGFKRDGDAGVLVSKPSDSLTTPEEAIKARGLDPAEWDVQNVKINEWDALGPNGKVKTMRQLTLYLTKRAPIAFVFPAVETEYRAPREYRPPNGSKLVVLVGDQQAPYQDPKLHDLFRQWLQRNKPHEGILIGDTLDFPSISRHKDNPEWHVGVQECINAGYLILRDYVRASEGTKWQKLLGNHDERIRNELLNRAERLYRVRPADVPGEAPEDDALSMRRLLHLDALGIDLVIPNGNYTHAQIEISPQLVVRHGWLTGANTAEKSLKSVSHGMVVGHTHNQALTRRRVYNAAGKSTTLTGVETGCMCRIEEGLGYAVDPSWVNGFATATVWKDGRVQIDLAEYVDGCLTWRKQRYA